MHFLKDLIKRIWLLRKFKYFCRSNDIFKGINREIHKGKYTAPMYIELSMYLTFKSYLNS